MQQPVTVAILGLGGRGRLVYAPYARNHPDEMKIVAVADIEPERMKAVAEEYGVPAAQCYASAEELLAQPKLADAVLVCTQDRQHFDHTIPALKKGYHVLLEKPISPSLEECIEIARVAKENDRLVTVCHVLRFAPLYATLRKMLQDGEIGKIVSVEHAENVGYWHMAHSFVRGNWRKKAETSPMILAKSCHDMDLIAFLMDDECLRVSSYGSLMQFRPEAAPEGAAKRCLNGCKAKDNCPYDCEKIYIHSPFGTRGTKDIWPLAILSPEDISEPAIYKALQEGPYGKCVFHCDNDVVDHQVVNMEFASGATASFTMCGCTAEMMRKTRIMGTLGEITADQEKIQIAKYGQPVRVIPMEEISEDTYGHGGGDVRMMKEFLDLIASGGTAAGSSLSSIDRSIMSHKMAFAAEESRLTHRSIELEGFGE